MVSQPPPRLSARRIERRLSDGERVSHIVIENVELGGHAKWALLGPSGSGKTTALEMLALATPPDAAESFFLSVAEGEFSLPAKGSLAADTARLRGRYFGYVLQSILLLPFLNVLENVLATQQIAGNPDLEFAWQLLDRLKLTHLPRALPADLSIGQRQRVCIARALAHRPAFVLADEPTSALDSVTAKLCVETLIETCEENNAALLLVTHDQGLVERFGFSRFILDTNSDGMRMDTRIAQPDARLLLREPA